MGENKDLKQRDKKGLILSCLLVLILIMSVFGVTYAAFFYGYSQKGRVRNTVSTGSVVFAYVENSNGISLHNAMPISDTVGKALEAGEKNNGYFEFSVSAKMAGTSRINYEVYATKQSVENELNEENVKIYLTDATTDQPVSGYTEEVPTYNNLKKALAESNSKQLYYGTFNSNGLQKFRLRMWVSDQYVVTTQNEQFKIKVNVRAEDR